MKHTSLSNEEKQQSPPLHAQQCGHGLYGTYSYQHLMRISDPLVIRESILEKAKWLCLLQGGYTLKTIVKADGYISLECHPRIVAIPTT